MHVKMERLEGAADELPLPTSAEGTAMREPFSRAADPCFALTERIGAVTVIRFSGPRLVHEATVRSIGQYPSIVARRSGAGARRNGLRRLPQRAADGCEGKRRLRPAGLLTRVRGCGGAGLQSVPLPGK
jgi:hypothetical protein